MKAAAQVGLFVVVAIVLFVAGVVVVGGRFGTKYTKYLVSMPDAGGLAKGSRVLMAGVQVGEVTKVGVSSPTQALLEIGIDPKTKLPLSTRALISGSLVGLGDTPLSLIQDPGYRGPQGEMDPGWTIRGGKAGPLDGILPDGGAGLYGNLNDTLKSVRDLLKDEKLQKDVRGLLATTTNTLRASADTLRAFTKIANRTSSILNENQGEIAGILRTTEGVLSSVGDTAQEIEKYAKSGKLQGGANALLADAHSIALESKSLLADLHKTLNDPTLNGDLRGTLANVKQASDQLPLLAENANKVAANADKIAANVADLTAKSQDLPAKLGTVLDNAADLENRLGGLSDKVGGVLGHKSAGVPPITTELDLVHESDPGYYRTDLSVSVPLSDGFVTAGLWDAFERNRVTLQLGHNASPSLDYRYGVYAGRPGVGVDYRLAPKLGFRGDLWDINNPRFDARLRYEFGGNLIGWLGVDRLFHDSALTVGVGIRR